MFGEDKLVTNYRSCSISTNKAIADTVLDPNKFESDFDLTPVNDDGVIGDDIRLLLTIYKLEFWRYFSDSVDNGGGAVVGNNSEAHFGLVDLLECVVQFLVLVHDLNRKLFDIGGTAFWIFVDFQLICDGESQDKEVLPTYVLIKQYPLGGRYRCLRFQI